jgi:CheY-specific phosphatase CheX
MWEAGLYKAAVRTFEDLGLLLPNQELSDRQRETQLKAAVGISFEGAMRGWLIVRVCGDVLPELTTSMLGEDREPTESEQQDALGEVANVICGNLLPDLIGRYEICHISGPMSITVDMPVAIRDVPPPTAAVEFGLPEGRTEVLLYVDHQSYARVEAHQ